MKNKFNVMRSNIIYIYAFSLSFLLVSCGVTKDYEKPEVNTEALFRNENAAEVEVPEAPLMQWDQFFSDPYLLNYIEEGLTENYSLKNAIQRVNSANALLKQSKKAFLPSLEGNASVAKSRLSYTQGFGFIKDVTQYDLGISTSWEADVWGKLSSAKRASLAALLQTQASKQAIESQLVANIAINYYQLIALDKQLETLEETAENRKFYVATMKKLKSSNMVNGAAVVQSEANQYEAELLIPDVKQQIREIENALSILLARKPGEIQRSGFDDFAEMNMPELSIGDPADLMANRPDVMQAELEYRRAFELTNVARTQFYPSFGLSGSAGFSSFEWDDLFTKNIGLFGNIAAGLMQPIFNKGINKANLATAKAEQQIAFNNFQEALLDAGKEVSDAVFAFKTANSKISKRALQLEALNKSVDYTKKLLQYNSQTNYTDVLTAEQSLLRAEINNINDVLAEKLALIDLYKALGGGWNSEKAEITSEENKNQVKN